MFADACGLGKTVTTLTTFVVRSHDAWLYRLTLVLAPKNVLDVWVEEVYSLIEWHGNATFNISPVVDKLVVNIRQSLGYRAL